MTSLYLTKIIQGLSPEKKQNIRIKKTKKKKKRRTSKHKGISMSIGEPPWATTRFGSVSSTLNFRSHSTTMNHVSFCQQAFCELAK